MQRRTLVTNSFPETTSSLPKRRRLPVELTLEWNAVTRERCNVLGEALPAVAERSSRR